MKKFLICVLAAAFFNAALFVPAGYCATVKEGTTVRIYVPYAKTSKNLVAGEKIDARIANNVMVSNTLVFAKDGKAELNTADVVKNGFLGNPGEILIIGGRVEDANGDFHNVQFHHKVTGEEKTYPKVLTGISIFFLFPLALFAFVKGGHAQIPNDAAFDVKVNNDFVFKTKAL